MRSCDFRKLHIFHIHALGLLQGTDKYVLRMADDDWDPDLDFPGLDSSAVITDVGVDQFVLCHQVCVAACFYSRVPNLHGCPGTL